jgi:hypothetical protein
VTEASLGILDTRGDGGRRNCDRDGEVVLHGGGSAASTKGVLLHLHPLGDSPRRSLADSGTCAPKALPTAELEGFLAGLIIAMPLEPLQLGRSWAVPAAKTAHGSATLAPRPTSRRVASPAALQRASMALMCSMERPCLGSAYPNFYLTVLEQV